MELKQIKPKKLLETSTNQEEIFTKTYNIQNISFEVNELEKLYKLENQSQWNYIIQQIEGLKKSLINFQSEQGLTLFGKQFENTFLVVSAGEINREIFSVYVEGIWEICNELT